MSEVLPPLAYVAAATAKDHAVGRLIAAIDNFNSIQENYGSEAAQTIAEIEKQFAVGACVVSRANVDLELV
jgi:hypothetical protein